MGKINMKTLYSNKTIDDWFDIFPLEHGVVAIGEPHHAEEVFCYVIFGKDKNILFDTGMGIKPLLPVLGNLGVTNKELIVINSHWHFDHIGGNKEFDKVLVSKNKYEAQGVVRGWNREDLSKYFFFDGFWHKGWPADFEAKNFCIPGYNKIEPVLQQDYEINLGDRVLRIIETPGHTPGGISLFDETHRILFTADTLYEGPLYCFEDESDQNIMLASLYKLGNLGKRISIIHPGHNYATNQPSLIYDAILLLQRAIHKEAPDAVSSEFFGVGEYHYPDYKRRLKLLVRIA